jgi:restriction system protein
VKLSRPGDDRPYRYIQCKAWGSEKVKFATMREFLGVMVADKISEGIFITTSDFRPEARAFAEANGIAALTAADFINRFNELKLDCRRTILADVTAGDYITPTCPSCDCKMVWREVEKPFWGCPKYPRCRSSPIYPRAAA